MTTYVPAYLARLRDAAASRYAAMSRTPLKATDRFDWSVHSGPMETAIELHERDMFPATLKAARTALEIVGAETRHDMSRVRLHFYTPPDQWDDEDDRGRKAADRSLRFRLPAGMRGFTDPATGDLWIRCASTAVVAETIAHEAIHAVQLARHGSAPKDRSAWEAEASRYVGIFTKRHGHRFGSQVAAPERSAQIEELRRTRAQLAVGAIYGTGTTVQDIDRKIAALAAQ